MRKANASTAYWVIGGLYGDIRGVSLASGFARPSRHCRNARNLVGGIKVHITLNSAVNRNNFSTLSCFPFPRSLHALRLVSHPVWRK